MVLLMLAHKSPAQGSLETLEALIEWAALPFRKVRPRQFHWFHKCLRERDVDFSKATWRKTTDASREHAVFELVYQGKVLLDVGFADNGMFEIAFHEGALNTVTNWQSFFDVVERGKKMAEADR